MADLEKKISKKIGKAIFEFKMIEPGDRILVAVSGGKDSTTLLNDLVLRRKSFPIKYEIEAVHVTTNITAGNKDKIKELFLSYNIPFHFIHINLLERLKPGKKLSCYWCSSQRRIELLRFADKLGCNKIALGHHMDDIVETFLINIFFKSEIATMLPKMNYNKFKQTLIRPMAFVRENDIIKLAKKKGFESFTCTCGIDQNSKRLIVKNVIKELSKNSRNIRENIFNAMKNVNKEYLP